MQVKSYFVLIIGNGTMFTNRLKAEKFLDQAYKFIGANLIRGVVLTSYHSSTIPIFYEVELIDIYLANKGLDNNICELDYSQCLETCLTKILRTIKAHDLNFSRLVVFCDQTRTDKVEKQCQKTMRRKPIIRSFDFEKNPNS